MNKTKQEKTSIDKGRIALKKFLMHQESGFLWDLYFVFYLKFNYQGLSEKKMTSKKTAEYIELYRETQLWFGDLPEDLGVFFRVAEMQGKSFFESCLLKSFENDFINKYNVEFLQQELLDHNRVVEKMISFYLDELGDQQVAECLNSKEVLFEQIKASSYSVKEKLELYEFFINPSTYIILLRRTLTEKQSLLSEYYKTHYKDIIGAYDPTELNKLNEKMKSKMQDQSKQEKNRICFVLFVGSLSLSNDF